MHLWCACDLNRISGPQVEARRNFQQQWSDIAQTKIREPTTLTGTSLDFKFTAIASWLLVQPRSAGCVANLHNVIAINCRVFSDKKVNYFATANKLFDEYNKILVVSNDNVQSSQMQSIRIALRGQAIVLMGKNVCFSCVV